VKYYTVIYSVYKQTFFAKMNKWHLYIAHTAKHRNIMGVPCMGGPWARAPWATPESGAALRYRKVIQSFLGFVFSKNSLFSFYSLEHDVHIRHRRDCDEQRQL